MGDFCASCAKEVSVMVTLNDASQPVKSCNVCGSQVANGVIGGSIARPTVTEGGQLAARPVANVPRDFPRPPAEDRPMRVIDGGRAGLPPFTAPRASTVVGGSAEDIVEHARKQLALLDLQIPELEAALASARTHRKGLAKMVAAYDSAAKPAAAGRTKRA